VSFGLDTEADMVRLLRINYDVVQATKGKKPADRPMRYTEGFAWKLFGHALTTFFLWQNGTTPKISTLDFLKEPGSKQAINFVDLSSIHVLARACTEVLLAFNYVYVQPHGNQDEREFRYLAWMLSGFSQRESYPVTTADGKKQVAIDIKQNEKQRKRVQKTAAFQALTARQQEAVLQGRTWHPGKSLSLMCEDVFGSIWGRSLYSFMSSHAHSDALSIVQVLQAGTHAKSLAMSALAVVGIDLARMTKAYAQIWTAAGKAYKAHEYETLNEMYLKFAEADPATFGLPTPREWKDDEADD